MDLDRLAQDEGWRIPYKIAANLPYAISTPLLTRLMARTFHWQTAVLMVQKEVAEKLTARPGDAAYGILSLAGRVFGSAEIILKAPAHVFTPMPAVESALVRLIRRPVALEADTELLRSVIQRAFGQRRKTLLNALKGLPGQDWASALELAGIDPRRRGETLSLEEYLALVEAASR
jgi:16S rRNA (adenine1518-N6/adenine1519-N6)-dimethyltransferase